MQVLIWQFNIHLRQELTLSCIIIMVMHVHNNYYAHCLYLVSLLCSHKSCKTTVTMYNNLFSNYQSTSCMRPLIYYSYFSLLAAVYEHEMSAKMETHNHSALVFIINILINFCTQHTCNSFLNWDTSLLLSIRRAAENNTMSYIISSCGNNNISNDHYNYYLSNNNYRMTITLICLPHITGTSEQQSLYAAQVRSQ